MNLMTMRLHWWDAMIRLQNENVKTKMKKNHFRTINIFYLFDFKYQILHLPSHPSLKFYDKLSTAIKCTFIIPHIPSYRPTLCTQIFRRVGNRAARTWKI
jgi:hypothetical protein